MDVDLLKLKLREFAEERNWDQYHSPKNLAMALSVEAGELVELFQWLKEEESTIEKLDTNTIEKTKEELADILLYLIRISDKLEIDLERVALEKIELNGKKYPKELAKNNAIKYNRRDE